MEVVKIILFAVSVCICFVLASVKSRVSLLTTVAWAGYKMYAYNGTAGDILDSFNCVLLHCKIRNDHLLHVSRNTKM